MNRVFAASLLLAGFTGSAMAQVGIDGVIGAEWAGATTHVVTYNASAAEHNFGAPGTSSTGAAYTTYFRGDANYIYAAVAVTPGSGVSAGQFANFYLSSTLTNGGVGIEVTNNRFFRPGFAGYYNAAGYATWSSNATTGVIEVAIPVSFFTNDPLSIGFATAIDRVRFNLSQSFGYSVVGGAAYGDNDTRLGLVFIPSPSAMAMLGLGGLAAARRRR